MKGCEQLPCAAKARGDLVKNQKHVVLIAKGPESFQVGRRVKPHASGPLHDGFKDHRRDLIRVVRQLLLDIGEVLVFADFVETAARSLGKEMIGEYSPEEVVHAVDGVADRHGGEGIPVVTAPDGQESLSIWATLGQPVLERDLDRDFHRDRARVREEDPFKADRCEAHKLLAELYCGLMGEPAKHDVRKGFELVSKRLFNPGVPVPVDRRPPRRHAIDQLLPVGEGESDALCRLNAKYRRSDRWRVGVPDGASIPLK